MSQNEEKTVIDLDDDDLDFDDAIAEEESADENKNEVELDDTLLALIATSVEQSRKQAIAYTDKRIEKVNQTLVAHKQLIEGNTSRLDNLEKVVEGFATGNVSVVSAQVVDPSAEPQEPPGIIDNIFGTIGGVLHGVVDTVAFVAESAVDLVTFGKARRPQ